MTSLLAAALLAQARPWTPPTTSLPRAFVEATAFLLAHGLGDPRGGEFREATAATTDRRTEMPMVVDGWVIPNGSPTRVVTTEGLVLPVAAVGPTLDLSRVVARRKASQTANDPELDGERSNAVFAALLLVAGRTDLASQSLWTSDSGGVARDLLLDFFRMESEEAKNAFDEGDDGLASRFATAVLAQRELYKAEAKRLELGAALPENLDIAARLMDGIAVDAARRVARPRPPLDLAWLKTRPAPERIAVLIDRLDEAKAGGIVFDGWSDPAADPIVEALAAAGDPAIGPLLDCVEKDSRLTRIGQTTSADWFTIYNFVPVREAAYRAIQQNLKIQALPGKDDVSGLREYWAENARRSPAERWLGVLRDDHAGLAAWRDMAWNLFGFTGTERRFPRPRPLPALSLSAAELASLSRVLERRSRAALSDMKDGDSIQSPVEASLTFAVDLSLVDRRAAVPVLQRSVRAAMAPGTPLNWLNDAFTQGLDRLGELAGSAAWNEYGDWVERRRLTPVERVDTRAFHALLEHRGVPRLRKAMRTLFAGSDSRWTVDRVERTPGGWWWMQDFLRSPLLEDPVFRAAVYRALEDRQVVGKAILSMGGDTAFEYKSGRSGDLYPDADTDPLRPVTMEPRPIRVADQVAMALAKLKGAPKFRPYWPDREKDLAIGRIKAFVEAKAPHSEALLN